MLSTILLTFSFRIFTNAKQILFFVFCFIIFFSRRPSLQSIINLLQKLISVLITVYMRLQCHLFRSSRLCDRCPGRAGLDDRNMGAFCPGDGCLGNIFQLIDARVIFVKVKDAQVIFVQVKDVWVIFSR